MSMYSCWTTSVIWTGSHFRPAGSWMDISTDCCTYWVQCVGVAAFSCGLLNIPTPVDQILDGCIVQTHVKIYALCKQRWPAEQHPEKKSGHMLHPLCHQGPLGTVCLHQDSDHVWLWPDCHLHQDTAKHGYFVVMKESTGEWNDTLLSSVIRVDSVFMRV